MFIVNWTNVWWNCVIILFSLIFQTFALAQDNINDPQHFPKNITQPERYTSDHNDLKILSLRIEKSSNEPEFGDDGIPIVLGDSDVIIRIFGSGITDQTVIAFTEYRTPFGGACLFPSTGLYTAMNGSAAESNTALFSIKLPKGEHEYYICAKNDNLNISKSFNETKPLVHQGTKIWCRIKTFQNLLPLWVSICIIVICLCFSALFSGLNLGLMSLDRTELKILRNTGTKQEQKYVRIIQPVRDQGNYLLCSILLGNVCVNSIFTILLDGLTSGLFAVIVSTLLIVVFGEITPQAICSRHGLAVGAKTILITKLVMLITFPLSYPVSKLLDSLLGEEIGNVYNRDRLKELVQGSGVNDLDKNEVNIIAGALELRKKTVADVMTRIEDLFMLPLDAVLDFETVSEIMKSGFSRIPVYETDRKSIVTLLYIKDLAFIDTDDNTPLRTLCEFYQNPCHFVFEDYTLDRMFNEFKGGSIGHLAFVRKVSIIDEDSDPVYETIGLVTLEDVLEELIQAEIIDETDVFVDNRRKVRRKRNKKQDFTIFAERKDNQNIRISPQLTLATFQYLSTSVEAFKNENISESILHRLLNQNIVRNIKCKEKNKNDPSLYIFEKNKPVNYFVFVIEGRVEVIAGKEDLRFESGPFTYFGTQALVAGNNVKFSTFSFLPDYSVRALTDIIYLEINQNLYSTAKASSILEKSRKSVGSKYDDDDIEGFLNTQKDDDRIFKEFSEQNGNNETNNVIVPIEDHELEENGDNGTIVTTPFLPKSTTEV